MSKKFVPSGDLDFKVAATSFANVIVGNAALYRVSQEDAELMVQSAARFEAAFDAANHRHTRSQQLTMVKEQQRAETEKLMRKIGRSIRANDDIDPLAKLRLKLGGETKRARRQTCPMEPPVLHCVRVRHVGAGAMPVHELKFSAIQTARRAKPDGAVRLELFVDLVPPNEPIPAHPGANHGGRPWYLRSYTRSPIVLTPPMARVPMRVVYWARWADSTGNVGPFSATAAGWVEGGNISQPLMSLPGAKQGTLIDVTRPELEGPRDATYTVALIETHYLALNAPVIAEPKQIEDQSQSEAA